MQWYVYILYAIFFLACLILIGVVLLQPGKSDAAAVFGGGSQTAFGARGAQKPLERITFGAAAAFMLMAFIFSLPGVTSPKPVAAGIEDLPVTAPAPPPPAPPAQSAPAATPAPADAAKPAEGTTAPATPAPAKDEKKTDPKASETDKAKDQKDQKTDTKADTKKK